MIQICSKCADRSREALNSEWTIPRARTHALDFAGPDNPAAADRIRCCNAPSIR